MSKTIKVLCCKPMIENLVREGRPFKFNLEFGYDCKSDEDIVVLKCTHNKFFVKAEVDIKKQCSCSKQFTCRCCLARLFMLNHMFCKVCIKKYEKLMQLPRLNEFLSNMDCKTKFYFNFKKNVINFVVFR